MLTRSGVMSSHAANTSRCEQSVICAWFHDTARIFRESPGSSPAAVQRLEAAGRSGQTNGLDDPLNAFGRDGFGGSYFLVA
jgi:hypothetical protein